MRSDIGSNGDCYRATRRGFLDSGPRTLPPHSGTVFGLGASRSSRTCEQLDRLTSAELTKRFNAEVRRIVKMLERDTSQLS